MHSDPLASKGIRVMLIIAGVIIFGSPIYYILAWGLGVSGTTISVAILLAIATFVIAGRYFNHRRIDKLSSIKSYRSTGATRAWPQKYSKHGRRSYKASANRSRKPESTPLQRNLLDVLRFALMPLQFVVYILKNKPEGDIKKDELLHRQTRHTPWS